jgi:hypothetical protein
MSDLTWTQVKWLTRLYMGASLLHTNPRSRVPQAMIRKQGGARGDRIARRTMAWLEETLGPLPNAGQAGGWRLISETPFGRAYVLSPAGEAICRRLLKRKET